MQERVFLPQVRKLYVNLFFPKRRRSTFSFGLRRRGDNVFQAKATHIVLSHFIKIFEPIPNYRGRLVF